MLCEKSANKDYELLYWKGMPVSVELSVHVAGALGGCDCSSSAWAMRMGQAL